EDFGAAIEGLPAHGQDILDADGNAEQRFAGCSARQLAVGGVGLLQGVGGIIADKGMDLALDALDPVQAGLHDLAGGNLAAAEFGGQFPSGQLVEHGGDGHSTILGTRNKPLAVAGALRSASACGREGRIWSERKTLSSGTAWAV